MRVLNLFAYTGGATLAVWRRAPRSAMWTRQGHGELGPGKTPPSAAFRSALSAGSWTDCRKFIERELRRGSRYDGYHHGPALLRPGPGGEVWKLEEQIYELCRWPAGF